MAHHTATVVWHRNGAAFLDKKYSRAHEWRFDGGAVVHASSSPHIVPLPYSDATAVDPEEAFIASLSSCHMLFFLSIAMDAGFVVDEYEDNARGRLERNAAGKLAMTQVGLAPRARFAGAQPSREQIRAWHHDAHAQCFLASSVTTHIECHPVDA
ncbi:MAG: OsmC family protein [Gemmatimonadota bacterium]